MCPTHRWLARPIWRYEIRCDTRVQMLAARVALLGDIERSSWRRIDMNRPWWLLNR